MTDRSSNKARGTTAATAVPEIDVKTGQLINPHNPEFITKKPWYLGDDAGGASSSNNDAGGPSLEHQQAFAPTKELSLSRAEELVAEQRRRHKIKSQTGVFAVGEWVEALKRNKMPYRMAQVRKVRHNNLLDLEFEDGTTERNVKLSSGPNKKPRVRHIRSGNRVAIADEANNYDAKRDAYHGFVKDNYTQQLASKYQERDELRQQAREQEQQQGIKDGTKKQANEQSNGGGGAAHNNSDSDFVDSDVDSDNSEDEFVQRDGDAKGFSSRLARQGGVGGAQMKVTARNLRLREDVAKYLRNLDTNSAYYDPKSRSMRDNPHPDVAPDEAVFAGDNFARVSGDAVELAQTQLFAWDAAERSHNAMDLHPQANPSQAELLSKQFKSKAADLKTEQKRAVLEKYGGAEHLDGTSGLASAVVDDTVAQQEQHNKETAAERATRRGVQSTLQQFGSDGRLVGNGTAQAQNLIPLPSKYEEDVHANGHTTVWGSYFHTGAFVWGYADDHSLLKNSYGTGDNGRAANDEAHALQYGTGQAGSAALAQARSLLKAVPLTDPMKAQNYLQQRSKLYGEADGKAEIDQGKLQEAIRKAAERDDQELSGQKKRKYNSVHADVDVTEEDMEAHRLRKEKSEDPMAKIGHDEVLEYQ